MDLEALMPRFSARTAEIVSQQKVDERIYIRVRTGRTRTTMKSIGRFDLEAGAAVDPRDMVEHIEQLITDGGSEYNHLLELMHYDPNGRAAVPLHTILLPASPEARAAESMGHVENGDTLKACIAALISMAQSADSRADRSQEKTLQLMEMVADHRVSESRLEGIIAAGQASQEDPRLQAAKQFAELIGPVMPTIRRRMEEASAKHRAAKNNGNTPTDDEPDTIDAAESNGELADALLSHLQNITQIEPGIWEDPARKAAALGIYSAVSKGAPLPKVDDQVTEEAGEDLTPES